MTPTGTLTKKIHSQPEVLGQHAAGEHADGGARAAHRAPDAERLVPLRALLEGRGDDRERGRGDDRGAEALHGARADQDALGPGETADERGGGEDDDADEEDAPPPEQVGRAPAEQQEAAERDRVGGDDPLQVVPREVEDLPIDGSATLTIETSRTVMKKAAQTTASAFQRRGSSSAISPLPPVFLPGRNVLGRGSIPSVPEVAAAGEDHRRAGGLDGARHLVVALRAAGLDEQRRRRRRARAAGRRRTGRTRRSRARSGRLVAELLRLLRSRSARRRRGSSGRRRSRSSGRPSRARSRSS